MIPLRINRTQSSINIRRGEGGGVDVGRAFMVARWWWGDRVPPHVSTENRTRATIKALPSPLHHPRPYGSSGRLSRFQA